MSDETVERFRKWLADEIWGEDDFGGFTEGVTPAQSAEHVRKLFDLIDPDWRDYTEAGRRAKL